LPARVEEPFLDQRVPLVGGTLRRVDRVYGHFGALRAPVV
jgi:hypothetical protein